MTKKKKKFNLEEVDEFMTKIELGKQPSLDEVYGIGEFIDELKEGESNE